MTDSGYELRSRGPASRGFGVLDNLVSRSRRSSPTRSNHAQQPPTPPPFPASTTAIAEPTIADVLAELRALRTDVNTLQFDMAAMKDKSASASDNGGHGRRPEGQRDHDPYLQHRKWDFPRFDGSVDPMLFINKCESYFRHHRTLGEERVRMASYHLDDVAQLWYS